MSRHYSWWQTGVIYQIYPRSFMDQNGDGIGDLPGIISKLDYLQWLGVDALWLSPIYPSPMADFGYDISDYTGVHPLFGSLTDMDTLIKAAHQRNLKVILDFVPNHTSDEHAWFQESRASRDNAKRDWYIWRDPAPDGGPPNNWTSMFGGSAWQFETQRGQYYLHLYDIKQADLNWRNPEVRKAMYDVMRFWLDRSVDGFRVDVLWVMMKDDQFRDNPLNPDWKPGDLYDYRQINLYTADLPEVHDIARQMRSVIDEYSERVFIGEIYLPLQRLMDYYGEQMDEAHLPFNFQLLSLPAWDASSLRQCIETYEAHLPVGGWPNWVLGNHDSTHIATRVGREQARVAQVLLSTLRGTPTYYNGDELGMQDVVVPPDMMYDPRGKENPVYSRDPVRSPMQWNSDANAGFSSPEAQPWLPVGSDYQTYNVATEQQDAHSHLNLARALFTLRRQAPALTLGSYTSISQDTEACFVYLRQYETQRYIIVLNCTNQGQTVHLPDWGQGHIELSTHLDREERLDLAKIPLRANEALVIELDGYATAEGIR